MNKAQKLRYLSKQIKEAGDLDSVTAVSSKTQYKKINMAHDPTAVYFVMNYKMYNGQDVERLGRIAWATIDNVKWDAEKLEDDLMVKLIVNTSGAQLINGLQIELSSMARNAILRGSNGT